MTDDLVRILEGNTFVVSDARGDIEASLTDPTGLFSFDTRFLSRWVLTVNDQRLNALSTDDLHYYETRFFLVPGTGTVYVDAKLSVIRQRAVGGGFEEQLTIMNHDEKAAKLTVRIEAGSDFADLFEVKDALKKKGAYSTRIEAGRRLVLCYERETFRRETSISATGSPKIDDKGLTFTVSLQPHASWTTELRIVTSLQELARAAARGAGARAAKRPASKQKNLERWLADAPRLECDWEPLNATYRRSLVDLAALRFSPVTAGGRSLPPRACPGS